MISQYLIVLLSALLSSCTSSQKSDSSNYLQNMTLNTSIFIGGKEIKLDKYLDIVELQSMMLKEIGEDFKHIAKAHLIGTGYGGFDIWAVQIMSAIQVPGQDGRKWRKPLVKLVGNLHGGDTVGYFLMVSLIKYLLYSNDIDDRISDLLESTEIWIIPTLDPVGLFGSHKGHPVSSLNFHFGRTFRGSDVDLDENFPHKLYEDDGDYEPETKSMLKLLKEHPFVLSTNIQSGAIVASYPFDHPYDFNGKHNSGSMLTPDNEFFEKLAMDYAKRNHMMASGTACNNSFPNGITNGNAWQKKRGSMQDANYILSNCFEISLYLSCTKYTPPSDLPQYWYANLESILKFIDDVHRGIFGIVKDNLGNPIKEAVIKVEGNDKDIKATGNGQYWRLLVPGKYNVTASAPASDYETKTVDLTDENPYVQLDFKLTRHGVYGKVYDGEGFLVKGAIIKVEGFDKDIKVTLNGEYWRSLVPGKYNVTASALEFEDETKKVNLTEQNPYVQIDFNLTRHGVYGIVYDEEGKPIKCASIKVQGKDIKLTKNGESSKALNQDKKGGAEIKTTKKGEYSMKLNEGNYKITASANGLTSRTKNVHLTEQEPWDNLFFYLNRQDGVYGEVTDSSSGEPIVEAVITMYPNLKKIKMDANGQYWTKLGQDLRVTLTASAPGYRSQSKTVNLNEAYAERNFQLVFEKLQGIHGQVKDEDNNPVTEAIIKVAGEEIKVNPLNGTYERKLDVGHYKLQACAHGFSIGKGEVDVTREHPFVRLDFVLKPGKKYFPFCI